MAQSCVNLAETITDQKGFIALRQLSQAFRADLVFRPLLVEGLIAKPRAGSDHKYNQDSRWKVLLDSDTFPVNEAALASESLAEPLPERLRFTVAHELAHTLSFRAEEFGVSLSEHKKRRESEDDFVGRLESETNALSPLLLVSEHSLADFLGSQLKGLALDSLVQQRKNWGVSRSVFISRLNLLRTVDNLSLRFHSALQGVILGHGTWQNSKSALLSSWPLFVSFGDNLIPEFAVHLLSKTSRKLEELIPLAELLATVDSALHATIETRVGTLANASLENALVDIWVEDVPRQVGSTFFFLVKPSKGRVPTSLI